MTKVKADFIVYILMVPALIFIIWLIVPKQYYVLVDNPCAPHHNVWFEGEVVDCTGYESNYRGYSRGEGVITVDEKGQ